MLLEEGQGDERVRQDGEGFGAADADRVGVAVQLEKLGDPVAHGDEVDDLAGMGTGDQCLQAVLGGPTGGHEPVQGGGQRAGVGGVGVDLADAGFDNPGERRPGQGVHGGGGGLVDEPCLVAGQAGGVKETGDLAGLPHPALSLGQRRPEAGVAVLQVDRVADQALRGEGPEALEQAEPPQANPATSGVPSPPALRGRSPPGAPAPAGAVAGSIDSSPCSAAQCAAIEI